MQIFAAANTSLIPLKTTLIMKRNHVVRLHRILINLIKLIKIRKKKIFFHEQEHSQFAHTLDQLFFDLSWTLLLLILSIESEVNLITKVKILKSAGIFVFTMICRRFRLHNDMPKISHYNVFSFLRCAYVSYVKCFKKSFRNNYLNRVW